MDWPTTASVSLLVALSCFGCRGLRLFADRSSDVSVVKSGSAPLAYGGVLRATIADGILYTSSSRSDQWLVEIQHQLRFSTGVFLGHDASVDLNDLSIDIAPAVEKAGPRAIHYAASFGVGWSDAPGSPPPPATLSVVLPRGGDDVSRAAFFAAYGASCSVESSSEPTFWHSYRPLASACPFRNGEPDRALAASIEIALEPARAVSPGARPASASAWSDARLVVTVLFVGPQAASGVAELVRTLRETYPMTAEPTSASTSVGGASMDPNDASVLIDFPGKGVLDVRALAAHNSVHGAFAARTIWNDRLPLADALVVVGPDSFGATSRRLASWDRPAAGRPVLGVLVAPGRFTYADPAWRATFADRGSVLDLLLATTSHDADAQDLILSGARAAHTVAEGLASGSATYADILRGFGPTLRGRLSPGGALSSSFAPKTP